MQMYLDFDDIDAFDESNGTFVDIKGRRLTLVHSLVSISKWESKYHKPFLGSEKTPEETIDYIKCMTIEKNVDPLLYNFLSEEQCDAIGKYVNDPMTATTVPPDPSGKKNREIMTSEVIYGWMVSYGIPFECEKWHLNRLLMLIQVCNYNNQDHKKMSKAQTMKDNNALNKARRAAAKSKG